MDLNLETLKDEIVRYLDGTEFAVFRNHAGSLEGLPMVTWDSDRFPDYRMFLESARKAGVKMVCLGTREIGEEEVDEAIEELEALELERIEHREFEKRLKNARRYVGVTCSLELAFSLNNHFYVYELQPDWYEDFLDAIEELSTLIPVGDDHHGESDSLGGFYSNN